MNIENFNFPLTLSVCFVLYSIVYKEFSVLFSSWLCYYLFGFYGVLFVFEPSLPGNSPCLSGQFQTLASPGAWITAVHLLQFLC